MNCSLKRIKMQKIKKIISSFYKQVRTWNPSHSYMHYIDIYQNPTFKDLKIIKEYATFSSNIAPYVKFLADFIDQKLYVWAGEEAHHIDIQQTLNLDPKNLLKGDAEIKHNKLRPIVIESFRINQNLDPKDWRWLDVYMPGAINTIPFKINLAQYRKFKVRKGI